MVTSDEEIAKTFKEYFDKIVPKLNIIQNDYKDIMKSKNIPSFSFQPVSIDKVKDIIKTLNTKKACPDGDIPVKLIKMNEDIFSRLIFQNYNQSLINGDFPHCLKQAEIVSVFKKRKNLTNTIIDL